VRASAAPARVVAGAVASGVGVRVAIGVARVLAGIAGRLGIAGGVCRHLVDFLFRRDCIAPLAQRLARTGRCVCVSHASS
jgi:hypothetical protein